MEPPNYNYDIVPRETIRARLADIAKYLTGITSVVNGMHKGAGDSLATAVRAIAAVSEDLGAHRATQLLPRPRQNYSGSVP